MTPNELLAKIQTMAKAVYEPDSRVSVTTTPDRVRLVVLWPGTELRFIGPTLGAAAGQAARVMRDLAQKQRKHAEQTLRDVALAEAALEQLVAELQPCEGQLSEARKELV